MNRVALQRKRRGTSRITHTLALSLSSSSPLPPMMSRQSLTHDSSTPTSSTISSPATSTLHHSLPALRSPSSTATNDAPSPLVTMHAMNLSLPHPPQSDPHIDALPYRLLLCEMPSVLQHSTQRAVKRRRKVLHELESVGVPTGGQGEQSLDVQVQSEVEHRLESIGAAVGANLAERLSRDRPPLPTTLEVLKFLCKDFWISIWDKQVDGLRTNHRGVYVLSDHAFKPLQRLSTSDGQTQAYAKLQLPHSVGLLRGALARMGVHASVVAESAIASNSAVTAAGSGAPGSSEEQSAAVTFHVRTAQAASGAGAGATGSISGGSVTGGSVTGGSISGAIR